MRKHYITTCFLLTGLMLFAEPPTLRDAVGDQLYQEAGLDKLSEQEQAALVKGLSGIFEEGNNPFFDPAEKEKRFGFGSILLRKAEESSVSEPTGMESRIVGEFRGWTGRTRFVLENGQVWVQAEDDTFNIKKQMNPKVFLERGLLGTYFLKVEGYGSRVRVKRLK
jgi:hypothetical protein